MIAMADYTNIETAMEIICDLCEDLYLDVFCPEKPNLGNNLGKCGRRKYLEEDAADVVPVVRCKDCKHSTLPSELTQRYGKPGTLTCHNMHAPSNRRNVGSNDFCSYGERKEND